MLRITLDRPARGVAKGQAAVLYDGDTVLGSGTISGTRAGATVPAGQSRPNPPADLADLVTSRTPASRCATARMAKPSAHHGNQRPQISGEIVHDARDHGNCGQIVSAVIHSGVAG